MAFLKYTSSMHLILAHTLKHPQCARGTSYNEHWLRTSVSNCPLKLG